MQEQRDFRGGRLPLAGGALPTLLSRSPRARKQHSPPTRRRLRGRRAAGPGNAKPARYELGCFFGGVGVFGVGFYFFF